jgi:DNA-binding NtrC family response regulator
MLNLFRRRRASEAIRLLALTRDAEGWKPLNTIAEAENWTLFWAHNSALAREVIARYSIPIVVCDRDLPNEDWRVVLAGFSELSPPVCTLLASQVADEYLWREIVHNKGFEILTKPFDPEKVIRTVRFAWTWRGWAQDHSASA